MRVVKNILMAFGVLLSAIVAFWVWIASSSANFRKQQAPFITAFVSDLSKHWDIADVSTQVTYSSSRRAVHKVSSYSVISDTWAP